MRLQTELNRMFAPARKRAPDYDRKERAAFKSLAGKIGMAYKIAHDGYLDGDPCDVFPEGFMTAFHGWDDALERLQKCMANPDLIESDGSYRE